MLMDRSRVPWELKTAKISFLSEYKISGLLLSRSIRGVELNMGKEMPMVVVAMKI
jgi:hypothetical protein